MKLKIECVKDVMEELESLPIGAHALADLPQSIQKHGPEDVLYTIVKLSEANYINCIHSRRTDGYLHIDSIYDLTFSGHEFLNTIRDPSVWDRIRGVAGDAGSACLKALGDIALELLKENLKARLSVRRKLFLKF